MTKTSSNRNWYVRLVSILSSSGFFYFIIGLLIVQALWIAASGRYPMAFDEDFHLGLIRLYAEHLSPWWTAHPAGGDAFGAVARDPSYLFHWLMAFPYAVTGWLTDSENVRIMLLRLVNIGLFAACLPLFRNVLLRVGASRALVHIALLAFILLPIVPLLAAQINYDNVFMPLFAGILLLTCEISRQLIAYKRIHAIYLVSLLCLCLLASLVKYAFLPFFVAIVIFLAVRFYRTFHGQRRGFLINLAFSFSLMTRRTSMVLGVVLIICGGLFIERYGVNLIRYQQPVADCQQVLTIEQCSKYGPWVRDYQLNLNKSDTGIHDNLLAYSDDWLYGMWFRTFFAVDGPGTAFATRGPLLLPAVAGVAVTLLSLVALIVFGRRVWQQYDRPILALWTLVIVCYVAILYLTEYEAYVRTGQPVAINGRYLLPVYPLLMVMAGLAVSEGFRRWQYGKLVIGGAAIACLLWGGGAMTYILRSESAWYWPNSPTRSVNETLQDIGRPVTPGGGNEKLFRR